MIRNTSLILATIAVSALLVGTFFEYHKSFWVPQMATVIAGLETDTDEYTQAAENNNDSVFSNEAVSNIASKNEAKDTGSMSTIAIETENHNVLPATDLVVEKTYSQTDEVRSSVSHKYDTNTVINDIQTLSNEARDVENMPALIFDAKLAQLAIDRSVDMAKHNYFSHTTLDGCDLECHFKKSEYDTMIWGENLAEFEPYMAVSADALAQELVKKWLQSSEHRRNLMSKEFTHEGIGVATSGNRIVVTVIFAKP